MDTMTIPTADSSLEEKAAFGARELDEKRPGWYREIELSVLDMHRAQFCIVGQLTGVYEYCEEKFGWDDDAAELRGLYSPCVTPEEDDRCTCWDNYDRLTQYWTIEVLNRRIAEQESV
jgi:hypothetical protein